MYTSKHGRRIEVRRAARRDIAPILKLWQAIADERKYIFTERIGPDQRARWSKSVGDQGILMVVAEVDDEIVGMLTLGRYGEVEKTRHIRNLGMGVAKEFRGIGVGRVLVDYAVKWAKRKGVEKIVLSVFSTNRKAIRLYEKFGFEHEGARKRQFVIGGRHVSEILMGLFLK